MRCARVERVFKQLFDNRCRTLDDFTRRDLRDDIFCQDLNCHEAYPTHNSVPINDEHLCDIPL